MYLTRLKFAAALALAVGGAATGVAVLVQQAEQTNRPLQDPLNPPPGPSPDPGRTSGTVDDDASKKAIEALQGTWALESYTTDGLAKSGEDESTTFYGEGDTIVGNRRVYRYKNTPKGIADEDDRIPRDEITIDASRSPRWFDSRSVNRPEGWVRLGIYKLEGDKLTICWRLSRRGMEDRIERPRAFEAGAGTQAGLSIYNRLRP